MSTDETTPNVQPTALFGRASGLKSRLQHTAGTPATPAGSDAPSAAAPAPFAPIAPAPAVPARTASAGTSPRPRVVHIASAVAEGLRQEAALDRNTPFAQIVFKAIEATQGKLDFPESRGGGGLFEPQTTARIRPQLRREQVTLRLTPRNEAVLDGIAQEHGVSRSDLVETALSKHLNITLTQDH